MTVEEFAVVKDELLGIIKSTKSEKSRLRAVELLLTLQERLENARWDWLAPASNRE